MGNVEFNTIKTETEYRTEFGKTAGAAYGEYKALFNTEESNAETDYDCLPEGYRLERQNGNTRVNTQRTVSAEHKKMMSKDGKTFDVEEFLYQIDEGGENSDEYYCSFRDAISQYQGKTITPQLVDDVINSMMKFDKSIAIGAASSIFRLQDYLSATTTDKFLKQTEIRSINDYAAQEIDVSDAKKFYNKLSPAQKTVYYQKLLNKSAVVGEHLMSDDASSYFVDYIFEKPISQSTFKLLKALFKDINESGNGVRQSRTATKNAIEVLLQRGQITQQQATELLRENNIK